MTPGAYLRKRREAAGLSLDQVAGQLAALPWALVRPSAQEIASLAARLAVAEADQDNLTVPQAELLRNAFRFDIYVYQTLLWARYGDRNTPLPQLCRHCACSWCDPCLHHGSPCQWVARDLCSACADPGISLRAAAAEIAGGVHV